MARPNGVRGASDGNGNPDRSAVVRGAMTTQPPSGPEPSGGIQPRPPVEHEAHDPVLVASLLDPDLPAELRVRAEAQLVACQACAELLADLRAIAAATAALPVPPRGRDFRLSAEDAERLRPRGFRRLVAALAAPRLALLRPLGAALATLGLAGLLLTATPVGPILLGSSGPIGPGSERDTVAPAAGPEQRPLEGQGLSRATTPPKLGGASQAEAQGGGRLHPVGGGPEVPVAVLFAVVALVGVALVVVRVASERAGGRRAPPG